MIKTFEYVKSLKSANEFIETMICSDIEEKFVRDLVTPYGGKETKHFTVLLNPTKPEIEKIEEEDFDPVKASQSPWENNFYLRAFMVDGMKIYAWYGDAAEHGYVARQIGYPEAQWKDLIQLELYFKESDHPLSINEAYEIHRIVYRGGPLILPVLKNCQPLKVLCASSVEWEEA